MAAGHPENPDGQDEREPSCEAVPTEADFGEGLDAQSAWKNFGGLSRDEAYTLVLTNPFVLLEDFGWMGHRAFAYYFPVLDRYLQEVSGDEVGEDCEVGALGARVADQLETSGQHFPTALVEEIEGLSAYVGSHLGQYAPGLKEQTRIVGAWRRVDEAVMACKRGCDGSGS